MRRASNLMLALAALVAASYPASADAQVIPAGMLTIDGIPMSCGTKLPTVIAPNINDVAMFVTARRS